MSAYRTKVPMRPSFCAYAPTTGGCPRPPPLDPPLTLLSRVVASFQSSSLGSDFHSTRPVRRRQRSYSVTSDDSAVDGATSVPERPLLCCLRVLSLQLPAYFITVRAVLGQVGQIVVNKRFRKHYVIVTYLMQTRSSLINMRL